MLTLTSIRLLFFVATTFVLASCTLGAPSLKLKDDVIENTVTWSGEVWIDGIVTVKKSGHLIIEPGTRILFAPRDVDGDGIGDAELLVEGSLTARGTARDPIIFTSAADQPKPADWKYLYLDFARDVELDYIVSEYAYSGLQVHFCRARVTNSIFRYNVDGLRFSTVNLFAAGNRMHDNQHGLRYEERGSEAIIHHNDIQDNEIGIFVVTRSTDRAQIKENNITGNRQYNVKLGWQQPGDVTLPNNWWGSLAPDAVEETFLDRKIDVSLGHVSAPEPLTGPVKVSDWQKHEGATP
ncbi:MAG: right-handed parallel beta-helix repeat-containing protein [Desulfuromonadales bacterium]|nr:right-handed parallel beta-helix repeat-containing protein [Desulfuromonadales bacterium]